MPLEPQKEAKLMALAHAKGVMADALVRDAIDKIIGETPDATYPREPTRSLRGLLAKYGTAPSAEQIDPNRSQNDRQFRLRRFLMIVAIADTHATIWHLFSDPRLGKNASVFIRRHAGQW